MSEADFWFGLSALGLMSIYWELLRPGWFAPAAIGLFLFLFGAAHLAALAPSLVGAALLVIAVACFGGELAIDTHLLGGILGTAALIAGSLKLCRSPHQIHAWLATTGGCLLGLLSWWLAMRARVARLNKRADL